MRLTVEQSESKSTQSETYLDTLYYFWLKSSCTHHYCVLAVVVVAIPFQLLGVARLCPLLSLVDLGQEHLFDLQKEVGG